MDRKTWLLSAVGLVTIYILIDSLLLYEIPRTDKTPRQPVFSVEAESFREYINLHNAITSNKTQQRYLIFSADGGLANQLVGIVSALWYAIATNRSFIGEGAKLADIGLFYDTPFHTWLVESGRDKFGTHPRIDAIDGCWRAPNAEKLLERLKNEKSDYLFFKTNCPLYRQMLKDPFFTKPLEKLGVDISSEKAVLGYFLRAFFKLKPETQSIIDEYKKKWDKYTMVVGFQIRLAGKQAAWGSDSEEFFKLENVPQFWKCAESFVPKKGVHYFIATDNKHVLDNTLNYYNGSSEYYEGGNIVHFAISKNSTFADKQKIFVDNHLLDLCDDLVVSGYSNFGAISIARSGRKHWHSVSEAGCSENKV